MPGPLLRAIIPNQVSRAQHAVILARVSSAEQREGKSLPAQLASCRNYCIRKQLIVDKEFSFTESSTRGDRKKFQEMMSFVVQRPYSVAIVADTLDRFQRSFKECLDWQGQIESGKIELHFLASGQVITQNSRCAEIMGYKSGVMNAEIYILQMKENILRGLAQKVKDQEYPGKAPVGYKNVIIKKKYYCKR